MWFWYWLVVRLPIAPQTHTCIAPVELTHRVDRPSSLENNVNHQNAIKSSTLLKIQLGSTSLDSHMAKTRSFPRPSINDPVARVSRYKGPSAAAPLSGRPRTSRVRRSFRVYRLRPPSVMNHPPFSRITFLVRSFPARLSRAAAYRIL